MANKEFEYYGPIVNGFVMLFIQLLIMAGIVLLIIDASTMAVVTAIVLGILWVIMTCGYVMLEPNESFVLIFFGNYWNIPPHRLSLDKSFHDQAQDIVAHP